MKVVAISPHLDDAVFSIGATLNRLVQSDNAVHVVTVFAGDPRREGNPSTWDAGRGLLLSAEVTEARRTEDRAATDMLGVEPEWLPFDDCMYMSRRDPDEIWEQLVPHLEGADAVLLPGWPLDHWDHRFTTMLVLGRIEDVKRCVLYQELPYALDPIWLAKSTLRGRAKVPIESDVLESLTWSRCAISADDRRAKFRAMSCYRGEVDAMGYDNPLSAVQRMRFGIETVAAPSSGSSVPALVTRGRTRRGFA